MLASRTSRDVIQIAHQRITSDWSSQHRARFDLHVSELVVAEARAGDPGAAARRLELIAVATIHGKDFLLTWNHVCKECNTARKRERRESRAQSTASTSPGDTPVQASRTCVGHAPVFKNFDCNQQEGATQDRLSAEIADKSYDDRTQ